MKLVLCSTPTFFVEEDEIVTALFEEGLDGLILRKPNSAPAYMERLLTLIPTNYYKRIITCQHYYLQTEYKLNSILLTDDETAVPEGYKGETGKSCRTSQELQTYRKKFDYLIYAPFPKETKKGGIPQQQPMIEELKRAKINGLIDKRVMVEGAVDEENLLFYKKCNFGGAVLGTAFWNKFDIRRGKDYNHLIDYYKTLKNMVG